MIEFLFSFGILLASVIAMAIGVIMGRDPIAGSCGGLKSLNGDTVSVLEKKKLHKKINASDIEHRSNLGWLVIGD